MTKATYDFMYGVTRASDGSFTLDHAVPAAHTVMFKSGRPDILPGKEIVVSSTGTGLDGDYDYVGSVTTAEGASGYIVYNVQSGDYYMMTNSRFVFGGHPSLDLGHPATTGANADMPVCLLEGTKVATPRGEIAVESLKAGDLVLIHDGRALPVRWIGGQTVAQLFADDLALPVRVKAGALDENVPSRDLLVSHDHALFVDGVLVQAGALINGISIIRETDVPEIFAYYNIELDDHALVLAENTPVETFVDNVDRARFDNWSEYEALYPEGKTVAELPYPRAKALRQVPVALRARLTERAVLLYGVAAGEAAA